MISLYGALNIANKELEKLASKGDGRLGFTRVSRSEEGWIFYYSSEDFLTGDGRGALLGGNAPIFVSHSGDVELLRFDDSRLSSGSSRGLRRLASLLEDFEKHGYSHSVSVDANRDVRIEVDVNPGTWIVLLGLDNSQRYLFRSSADAEPAISNVVDMWQQLL